ncbi:MAG: hypothetical protein COB36_08555 [Alphaproteobacteria bacterium]|nr:MAG: hypothetical protein COB36_08555 [Alphaproteobacteria bacterium]
MDIWGKGDYQATLYVSKTRYNVSDFVRNNKKELWKIFLPLLPFILGLHVLDAVISDLYYSDGENRAGILGNLILNGEDTEGFFIGEMISGYFFVCLAISWHRLVIQGIDTYTPMKPFSPKKYELVFVGAWLLACVVSVLFTPFYALGMSYLLSMGVKIPESEWLSFSLYILLYFLMTYIFYRCCFYFPAKAVNAKITLKKAFSLSGGHLWRLFFVMFRTMFLWTFFFVAYVYIALLAYAGIHHYLQISSLEYVISLILYLPMVLYVEPILIVLGVTALSNYYLYALQNEERAVEG